MKLARRFNAGKRKARSVFHSAEGAVLIRANPSLSVSKCFVFALTSETSETSGTSETVFI
jgi:hypothetical protein